MSSSERRPVYPAAGFELQHPLDTAVARVGLRVLLSQPEGLRENVLFGRSRLAMPLQKLVQHLLGPRRKVLIRYIEGPPSGSLFQCWTDEKYFFLGSGIERKVGSVLQELAKAGCTVYDVGAHAGFWVLGLSAMVGPKGRVFAFEPSKVNFERLSENVRLNARENVTPVNLGASDVEGPIHFSDAGSYSHVVLDPSQPPSPVDVESVINVIPLDDFAYRDSHPEPDVLLIDVEGHAGHVLRGAERLLSSIHPEIICEIHNPLENNEVLAATSRHGYKVLPIDSASKFPRRVRLRPVVCP